MSAGIAALSGSQQTQNIQANIITSLLKSTDNLTQAVYTNLIDSTTQQFEQQMASMGIGRNVNTFA